MYNFSLPYFTKINTYIRTTKYFTINFKFNGQKIPLKSLLLTVFEELFMKLS